MGSNARDTYAPRRPGRANLVRVERRLSRQIRLAEVRSAGQARLAETVVPNVDDVATARVLTRYTERAGMKVDECAQVPAFAEAPSWIAEMHSGPREVAAGAWAVLASARRALAVGTVLALLFAPRAARAESLPALAQRVERTWTAEAAVVRALPARFLFDDEVTTIVVPEGPADRPCLTVAAIAVRGVSTELWFGPKERAADLGLSRASSAGIVELRIPCGMTVRSVSLGSHAGRGAVEVIAAWHRSPLTPVSEIINERASGDIPTPLDVGPVPWPNLIDKRVQAFEANTAARGLIIAPRRTVKTVAGTVTRAPLTLEPGCHALRMFTEIGQKGRRSFVDLDADLLDADGLVLARDRADAIDATLEACVASQQAADLVIGATPADADVIVASGHAPLPAALPVVFGDDAAARMARALLVRHVAPPRKAPVSLSMGGAQTTRFAEPVIPGACYVGIVVASIGQPRRLRLQISVGAQEHTDEHGRSEPFAVVSFCSGRQKSVAIEIESRGREAAWGFSLFRVGDGPS